MSAQAGTCPLHISRSGVFGPTGQPKASPWEYNHVRIPKPQSGRPYSVVKRFRTAPLGLGRLAESIPRTTSGAITGLARWADSEFSTYAYPMPVGLPVGQRCQASSCINSRLGPLSRLGARCVRDGTMVPSYGQDASGRCPSGEKSERDLITVFRERRGPDVGSRSAAWLCQLDRVLSFSFGE